MLDLDQQGLEKMSNNFQKPLKTNLTFGDVFAGCGGLSLGLINAGWKGLFAIEKNQTAFETLKTKWKRKNRRLC